MQAGPKLFIGQVSLGLSPRGFWDAHPTTEVVRGLQCPGDLRGLCMGVCFPSVVASKGVTEKRGCYVSLQLAKG